MLHDNTASTEKANGVFQVEADQRGFTKEDWLCP